MKQRILEYKGTAEFFDFFFSQVQSSGLCNADWAIVPKSSTVTTKTDFSSHSLCIIFPHFYRTRSNHSVRPIFVWVIRLQFQWSFGFPFFSIGITVASFQASGTDPDVIDLLIMLVRGFARILFPRSRHSWLISSAPELFLYCKKMLIRFS